MLNIVKNDDFAAAKTAKKAVVDFNAVWCGPCRMLAPIFDELADVYDGKVEFFSVDVDENSDIAGEYGIQSIPTIIVLENGVEVRRSVGLIPKERLVSLIGE